MTGGGCADMGIISPTGEVNKTILPAKTMNQLTSNIGDQYVLTINVI